MARFRFVAIDSSGRAKQGAFDADTEAEAIARIEQSGMRLESIAPEGSETSPVPLPTTFSTHHSRRRQAGGVVPTVLAALALIVACAALGLVILRDPLGSGLSKYDFSTPKSSLESRLKMEINNDLRAVLELQRQTQGKKIKEKLDTLEVRREAEFRGRKILFVVYKADGFTKYNLEFVEKDANTGYWLPSFVSVYDVEKENKDLATQMRKWEE